MIGYIYKIISPNGKPYIGQTINLKKRYYNYRRGQCETQKKLFNAILKYGWDNFSKEVLYQVESKDIEEIKQTLNEKEIYFILEYDSVENGLNLTYGGHGFRKAEKNLIIGLRRNDTHYEKEYAKIYKLVPKRIDYIKKYSKQYYKENRETIISYYKEYRKTDAGKEVERRCYATEKRKAYMKEYNKRYAESGKLKIAKEKYKNSEKGIAKIKEYSKKYTESGKAKEMKRFRKIKKAC